MEDINKINKKVDEIEEFGSRLDSYIGSLKKKCEEIGDSYTSEGACKLMEELIDLIGDHPGLEDLDDYCSDIKSIVSDVDNDYSDIKSAIQDIYYSL